MDNYYQLLGISYDADAEDIKKAFLGKKKEAQKLLSSRDINEQKTATARISLLTKAYKVLKDDSSRAEYDKSIDNIGKKSIDVAAVEPVEEEIVTEEAAVKNDDVAVSFEQKDDFIPQKPDFGEEVMDAASEEKISASDIEADDEAEANDDKEEDYEEDDFEDDWEDEIEEDFEKNEGIDDASTDTVNVLDDSELILDDEELTNAESNTEQPSVLSKYKYYIGALLAGILGILAYLFVFMASPEKTIENYITALGDRNYTKAYDFLYFSNEDAKFYSKSNFEKQIAWAIANDKLSRNSLLKMIDGNVTKVEVKNVREVEKEGVKCYQADIAFKTKASDRIIQVGEDVLTVYEIKGGPGNMFKEYKLYDATLVSKVDVIAPAKSKIFINNVELELDNSESKNVSGVRSKAANIIGGQYSLKIENELSNPFEAELEIPFGSNKTVAITKELTFKKEALQKVGSVSEDLLKKLVNSVLAKGGTNAIGYSYPNDTSIPAMYNKLSPFFFRANGSGVARINFTNTQYGEYSSPVTFAENVRFINNVELKFNYNRNRPGGIIDARIGNGELVANIEYVVENGTPVFYRIVNWNLKLH